MREALRTSCLILLLSISSLHAEEETLPPLKDGIAPSNFEEMWSGFDPEKEPLEVETRLEWEEDDVVLRIVRFRIGIFKGQKAKLAAVYGYPKSIKQSSEKIPGLVQIHGGGQYADYKACLLNAKRGYATVSIAWAGRISAPDYRVTPKEVKLFWDNKTDDPAYRATTNWGALDGYHAPGRNSGNVFPSAKAAEWTLDSVESPRNSGWYLCALAARRALTFLEHQPEVDPDRLGVYGHSMGGKLTVMTAVDSRVKAAAPSCGGISDRYNSSELFNSTIGDDVSLKHVSCPIVFLSPANDFHGRIGDLPDSIEEIQSGDWRVTCSPHHNHQDTAEYEVDSLLWFDQHLKQSFQFPQTPETTLKLKTNDDVPLFKVRPDAAKPIRSVDIFYTQHGKPIETPTDRINSMHRFWHHADAVETNGEWQAKLPIATTDQPLWVFANVNYELEKPVTGAGYYYGEYTANSFNLSSLLKQVSPEELAAANVKPTHKPSPVIETFDEGWEKEWFTYRPQEWARSTHKLYQSEFQPPKEAKLELEVLADQPNELVILIDDHTAVTELSGGSNWQKVSLSPDDFKNIAGETFADWNDLKRLKLSPSERLRPGRGQDLKTKVVGKNWQGAAPRFRNMRWALP